MAAHLIEEERGTYGGHLHPHGGYYAGDFSGGGQFAATSSYGRVVRCTTNALEPAGR